MKRTPKEIIDSIRNSGKDIVILGPSGNKNKQDYRLRVYSNGSDIGKIPITMDGECELATKKSKLVPGDIYPYDKAKYLRKEGFVNGRGTIIENKDIELLEERYHSILNGMTVEEYYVQHFCEAAVNRDYLISDPVYLDMACLAAYNWSFNKKKNKKIGERGVQTHIARRCMDEKPGDGLIVTDIEFTMGGVSDGEVDFVLFDGKRFGLVELKYNAESMGSGQDNSLYDHMCDFYKVLSDNEKSKEQLKQCLYRAEILSRKGIEVISNDWNPVFGEMIDSIENEADPKRLMWCGFLFVGGDKTVVLDEVKKQLLSNESIPGRKELNLREKRFDGIDVMYQYVSEKKYSDENYKITMSKDIRTILDL